MLLRNYSPTDLASTVCSELTRRRTACPRLQDLIHLFEAIYFASLKTEEAQQIAFHIVYLDPNNPDPKPPMRITKDRWCFVRIAEPIPITISNLVKIAKASDPRTSSFAVYPNTQGELYLWGLVDQGNSYHDFINYDSESGGQRPGIFQASIVGVGHLVASIGYSKIAELKVNNMLRNSLNVLEKGPVYDTIEPGIKAYIDKIKRKLPERVFNNRDQWDSNLKHYWVSSLCRLLLRIKNYHHGGAILITPDNSFRGLNVKYRVQYERLRTALETRALLAIQSTHASDEIFKAIASNADSISAELYLS